MAEQISGTPAGKEAELLGSLRTVMPTLRKRSEQCFVNLFVNYADESGRDREVQPDIKVFIAEEGDQVRIEITVINGSPCLWSERLFESLWSEKGGGLGIGLYLMRQLITEAGDTLQAFTPTQEPMKFVISLPRSL